MHLLNINNNDKDFFRKKYFSVIVKNRIRFLFVILFDLLIINSLFFYYSNSQIFEKHQFLEISFFSITWVIISFIADRYIWDKNNLISQFFGQLIRTSIVSIISRLFLSAILLFMNNQNSINSFSNFNYQLIFLSGISQFILSIIFNKYSNIHNKWIFLGNIKTFNLLNQLTKLSRKNIIIQNIIFEDIHKLLEGKREFRGIIVDDNYNLIEFKKNHLLDNYELLDNPMKWCERELECLPIYALKEINYFFGKVIENKYSLQLKVKRFGEFILSLLILTLTSPIILFFAILIYLEDKGPIFYTQLRNGRNLKKFKILKLRTMKIDAEIDGVKWSSAYDNRVTKIGYLLRKTRIDELPQLLNVLNGDMCLIGPRPERPEIDEILLKNIENYAYRYNFTPGLSGWAQVCFPYGASIEDSKHKLSFDAFYIKNFSIFLDFLILFKTMRLVFNARGSDPN